MSIDEVISGLIYLVAVFFLFFVGKIVYDRINRRFVLQEELLQKDNFAMAIAVVGYYLGLVFAIGGTLEGPASFFWLDDVLDILFYGIVSIVLLNLSAFINDKIILYKFDNVKEIVDDRNAGTGVIEAANHIAVGLVIYGAISGEGDLTTAAAFWLLGQAVLLLASFAYNWITPFDVHDEIEKDNVAVGVAFAGMLIAIGNVIRIGLAGDFISWSQNLAQFGGFVAFGLILLPVLRVVTDKLLLPGESLTKELVHQEKPNVGAGAIEAFSYVAASFLLGWVV
jgi:uncharacterized membrane protein YjfL (UPF0719 family)